MSDWDAIPTTDEWIECLDGLSTLGDLRLEPETGPTAYLYFGGDKNALRRPGAPHDDGGPSVAHALASPILEFVVFPVVARGESNGSGVRVGRTEENDITIPDESVAGFHAALAEDSGAWFLRPGPDPRVSGLKLNDAQVSAADPRGVPLRSGDRIQLGDVEVAFLLADDAIELAKKAS